MYRPIDVLTVQRRGEQERRAVQPCRSIFGAEFPIHFQPLLQR